MILIKNDLRIFLPSIRSFRHFWLHNKLSSASCRHALHVWAQDIRSFGDRFARTLSAKVRGRSEIKSRWNRGSITEIKILCKYLWFLFEVTFSHISDIIWMCHFDKLVDSIFLILIGPRLNRFWFTLYIIIWCLPDKLITNLVLWVFWALFDGLAYFGFG